MKSKSIFSKILSGALALGMVATMLPAMSLRAEAAATSVNIWFGNWSTLGVVDKPDSNRVSLLQYDEDLLATPNQLTEIGVASAHAGFPTASWAGQDNSKDIKLVILPGDYWEYTTDPSVVGWTPATEPQEEGLVNKADVWADVRKAEHEHYTIVENTADKSGRSFILTINKNELKDGLSDLCIRLSQPVPIETSITVNVAGNVSAQETSILPQVKSDQGVIGTSKTWHVMYDPDKTNREGTKGAYVVWTTDKTVRKEVTKYNETHDNTAYANQNNWYSSEIMIQAEHNSDAGDFGVTVSSDNGRTGDLAKTVDEQNYRDSKLVAILDPAKLPDTTNMAEVNKLRGNTGVKNVGNGKNEWTWATGKTDLTSYIGIYNLNGDFFDKNTGAEYDGDGAHDTALKFNDTSFDKTYLPEFIDEQIWLTINPEDIYRLYVFGNATDDDAEYGGDLTQNDVIEKATRGTTYRQGGQGAAAAGKVWTNRYGAYKNVVINLGTSAKKGSFKVENGTSITNIKSVANMYKYSYVIRRANGMRWDGAESSFDTYATFSADPQEWPLDKGASASNFWYRGYQSDPTEDYMLKYDGADIKEGDKIEFKVLIDPTYQKGSGFKVEVIGNDNRPGHEVQNTPVSYDEATDTYSFIVGPYSPYRIKVRGVEEKPLRWVRNIPEDRQDSSYYPIPSYDQDESRTGQDLTQTGLGGHLEEMFLLDAFYEYFDRFRSYDSCNVANPRHQIYIMAHEEDDLFVDMVAFARRRAVATEAAWSGHQFPVGDTKFKVRYNNQFVIQDSQSLNASRLARVDSGDAATSAEAWREIHGTFDSDVTNDRYTAGPNFKVSQTSAKAGETELKPDDNGVYTLKVADEDVDLRVDGIIRAYYVYAPNVAGYNIEANYPMQRETYDAGTATGQGNNFRSSVGEGYVYRFKLVPSDGSQKGHDFKVMLRAAGDDQDNTNSFIPTEIKEDAEGYYSFTVNNDVEIIIYGMTGTGFNDVSNRSEEEQEAINWLRDNNVIDGYDDGSFRPGNNLTRAEFVKMLYALKGGSAGNANFSDTNGHWAAGQIGWGSAQNIVNGYPDGTFKPNQSITRAEVSQVIWKLAGGQRAGLTANFADVSQSGWYAPAVNWAFEKGVVKGYGTGAFGTNDPIERAHMALILYRARGLF